MQICIFITYIHTTIMSDYYNENKLKLVVRKVQSGKTFILAEDIEKDKTDTIHIIFTMKVTADYG